MAGASRGLRTGRPRAGSRPRRRQVRQEEQCRPPTTARPLLATSPLQLHPLQPPPTHTHLFLIFTNMMEKQNLDAGLSRDERPGASHQSPDASSRHRRGFHEPRAPKGAFLVSSLFPKPAPRSRGPPPGNKAQFRPPVPLHPSTPPLRASEMSITVNVDVQPSLWSPRHP